MDKCNRTPGRVYTLNVLEPPVTVALVKEAGTTETLTTWEETGPHEIRALTSRLRFEGGTIGAYAENAPGFSRAALSAPGGGASIPDEVLEGLAKTGEANEFSQPQTINLPSGSAGVILKHAGAHTLSLSRVGPNALIATLKPALNIHANNNNVKLVISQEGASINGIPILTTECMSEPNTWSAPQTVAVHDTEADEDLSITFDARTIRALLNLIADQS